MFVVWIVLQQVSSKFSFSKVSTKFCFGMCIAYFSSFRHRFSNDSDTILFISVT